MNNDNEKELKIELILEKLSGLSDSEFLDLGNGGLSYIKSVNDKSGEPTIFALHGADGSHIATGQDLATLHVIAKQHDLLPMTVQ